MNIINKDIIKEVKKNCTICESNFENNGIEVMGIFICEECVSKINAADVNTVEYETIKNSIKKSITSKILNLNEL
ncbi:sigma factor G inhibitor Gin [Clostridium sp.]|jgi:hypothetical protein|uniref:sigma factor G inhibitor Gin n=1 Tax=Clostridium sp. TaxID=1506 RepID=UPI0025C3F776|nr:sigma factor G inhibitor Gin [Clostridium sp.]MCI9070749.1 hypothetical protein [Clostridium sp.]MCI9303755.1 hypothetical protein [Clostridium sp.]